jgi:hypothetical protein
MITRTETYMRRRIAQAGSLALASLALAWMPERQQPAQSQTLTQQDRSSTAPAEQIEDVTVINYLNSAPTVKVRQIHGVNGLFFQSKMSCDVDGSPNAYHPLDDRMALDDITSAGGERVDGKPDGILTRWPSREIVAYRDDRPYVQPEGENAGCYVSKTSLAAPSPAECDPHAYLDARHIQYIVLPDSMVPQAHLGDLAVAYDPQSGRTAYCVYGDVGPRPSCGEASLATLQRLHYATNDGRTSPAETRRDVFYLVFPGTSQKLLKRGWPLQQSWIDSLGQAELRHWGGVERIKRVAQPEAQLEAEAQKVTTTASTD